MIVYIGTYAGRNTAVLHTSVCTSAACLLRNLIAALMHGLM